MVVWALRLKFNFYTELTAFLSRKRECIFYEEQQTVYGLNQVGIVKNIRGIKATNSNFSKHDILISC